ncbi:hypothetical protein [Paenibacillus humicola]|uniref:hypothetical protein n=1 Tax=Paenibacillus humicola TaxID=3110540 RepID=UPI00237AFD69|nr:hypothetical protein [Paenibacillus humicola]
MPNDASAYFYNGGNAISYIKIHDGMAEVVWQAIYSAVGNSYRSEAGIHQNLNDFPGLLAFYRESTGLISYGTILGDSSLRKTYTSDLYTDIIQPNEKDSQ